MYCAHCGNSIPDESTVCGYCGNPVVQMPVEQKVEVPAAPEIPPVPVIAPAPVVSQVQVERKDDDDEKPIEVNVIINSAPAEAPEPAPAPAPAPVAAVAVVEKEEEPKAEEKAEEKTEEAAPVEEDKRLKPTKTSGFFWAEFLLLIPIVNIVLLFVWAFSKKVRYGRRNFARSILIWALIGVIIAAAGVVTLLVLNQFNINIWVDQLKNVVNSIPKF